MSFCTNCGYEVGVHDKFCRNCGATLAGRQSDSSEYDRPNTSQTTQMPQMTHNLRTDRGLLKLILLNLITCGIYGIVQMSNISEEINVVASKYDGRHTMHFLLAFLLLGGITLGIVPLVWTHRICNRMGEQLSCRNINYSFSAGTFWGWGVLGMLIFIGPMVYQHKFLKTMNLINEHYNQNGY